MFAVCVLNLPLLSMIEAIIIIIYAFLPHSLFPLLCGYVAFQPRLAWDEGAGAGTTHAGAGANGARGDELFYEELAEEPLSEQPFSDEDGGAFFGEQSTHKQFNRMPHQREQQQLEQRQSGPHDSISTQPLPSSHLPSASSPLDAFGPHTHPVYPTSHPFPSNTHLPTQANQRFGPLFIMPQQHPQRQHHDSHAHSSLPPPSHARASSNQLLYPEAADMPTDASLPYNSSVPHPKKPSIAVLPRDRNEPARVPPASEDTMATDLLMLRDTTRDLHTRVQQYEQSTGRSSHAFPSGPHAFSTYTTTIVSLVARLTDYLTQVGLRVRK